MNDVNKHHVEPYPPEVLKNQIAYHKVLGYFTGTRPTIRLLQCQWNNHETWQRRHNERGSVSNHQPHDCLLNRLFRRKSKKTSKLRVTGLCARNSPGTGEFPAQMAGNAEKVSNWWRHHEMCHINPQELMIYHTIMRTRPYALFM